MIVEIWFTNNAHHKLAIFMYKHKKTFNCNCSTCNLWSPWIFGLFLFGGVH